MSRKYDEIGRNALNAARGHYDSFSRSTQILVIVGAASLLLLLVLEGWTAADNLNMQTDKLLGQMRDARTAKEQIRPAFRDQVQSLGNIRLPEASLGPTTAEKQLKLTVDTILAEHGAENERSDITPGSFLSATAIPEIPRPPGRRLAKISMRIDFDCPQDQITSIIKELEADPEVYTISRMQIRRYEDGQEQVRRLVNVALTLETWVLGTSSRGGRS